MSIVPLSLAAATAPQPARPTLSVVLPIYNEAANIAPLFERLAVILAEIALDYEIICIDDGSRDDSFARLAAEHGRDPRIKVVGLSRNFGKEVALTAGLAHAAGRAVLLMDADLQHPPELIRDMVQCWLEGAEVVYAARASRQTDGRLRRLLTGSFYRAFASISEVRLPPGAGDFRLLDRKVVDALNALPERVRFMKGLYAWVGFRQRAMPYEPAERGAGSSSFNFRRLWRFALDGLTSFSSFPLKVWTYVGLAVAIPSVLYAFFITLRTLLLGTDVPGYASVMVATTLLGGVQLICLGVIGEYLGRIFYEVKGRPLYLVRDSLGFEPPSS